MSTVVGRYVDGDLTLAEMYVGAMDIGANIYSMEHQLTCNGACKQQKSRRWSDLGREFLESQLATQLYLANWPGRWLLRMSTVDGKNVDGDLTLAENIADNGGIKISYEAFVQLEQSKGKPATESDKQLFFLSWGQVMYAYVLWIHEYIYVYVYIYTYIYIPVYMYVMHI